MEAYFATIAPMINFMRLPVELCCSAGFLVITTILGWLFTDKKLAESAKNRLAFAILATADIGLVALFVIASTVK